MANRKINIPRSDVNFNTKQEIIANFVDENLETKRLDKNWVETLFKPARKKWEDVWKKCQDRNQRTKVLTFEKNQAREEYEPLLRLIMKNLEVNTLVTDEERAELGIFPTEPRSITKDPTSYPELSVRITAPRELIVGFRNHGSVSRAKPTNIHGMEIRYAILGNSPKSVDELIHSDFDTHSPVTLKFKEEDRGKTVWMCGRWENTRGGKGPWSEFYSAIIP
jgi:hypothetical protein